MRTFFRRSRAAFACPSEGPLHLDLLDAEQALLHFDVVDQRPVLGKRSELVEVLERLAGLIADEVGELLGDLLPLFDQLEHRLFALDRALLAGEPGDVAGSRSVWALGVDERPLAFVGTEVTHRLFVVLGRVLNVDRVIETDERGRAAAPNDAERFERRAQCAGFAGVRVDIHLGVWNALLDVVDLRFDRGQVVLRAALEHIARAKGREPRDLDHVLPHVLRKDLGETGQELFLAEALLLEVHAIRVQEHRTAVAKNGGQLGFECRLRILGDG